MLKKILITSILAAGISAVALSGFAQVKVSGFGKAYLSTGKTETTDIDVSPNAAGNIHQKETTTTDDVSIIGKAGVSFSYSERFGDWTASFGIDTLLTDTAPDLTRDSDIKVSLGNGLVSVSVGYQKYLGGLLPAAGFGEETAADLSLSGVDIGDVNGRHGSIGVALTPIPDLVIKVGLGAENKSSKYERVADPASDSITTERFNKLSSAGLLARYSIAGVTAALTYGSKMTSTGLKDTTTSVGGFESIATQNTLGVGFSYDVGSVSSVPINVWIQYLDRKVEIEEKGAAKVTYTRRPVSFNTIDLGLSYDYGLGDAGFNYTTANNSDKLSDAEKAAGTTVKKGKGTIISLHNNFNLSPTTKIFASYSISNVDEEKLNSDPNALNTRKSGLILGVKQSF